MQQASERATIAASVIVHDGHFLLVQRRVSEGSLSWQFPAGEIEPGETPDVAAARETFEETGLTVNPIRVLGARVHPATGRKMVYVACDVVGGDAHVADVEELAAVAWCSLDDIPLYVPYGFYEPVQEYLEAQIAA